MVWEVQFHAAFEVEVLTFEREVRIALIAATRLLSTTDLSLVGPMPTRPKAQSTPT